MCTCVCHICADACGSQKTSGTGIPGSGGLPHAGAGNQVWILCKTF